MAKRAKARRSAKSAKSTKRATSSRRGFRLTAPTQSVFLGTVILAVISLLAVWAHVPHAFWLAMIAYIVLALAVALKGM